MAQPEWGMKHECPNCSVRFYDLQKPSPITCPSCGFEFETDVLHRARKAKTTTASNDDDQDTSEEEAPEIEAAIDTADPLLLHDNEDDEIIPEGSNIDNLDDNMFPDEDAPDIPDDLPEDLLDDDDTNEEGSEDIKK